MPTRLILVGGFLGAGKTTLILCAARQLIGQGARVAVITNDQDAGLVDTRIAEASHIPTGEVAGGCFCCRFSDLLASAERLKQYNPEIIFAEPVGSCVDLSATILQPLKAFHRASYSPAPLTVLIDPAMATRVFAGQADDDVAYLFRKQLAEADLLCATKIDSYSAFPELPVPIDFHLSARTGEGITGWLNEVLHGSRIAGARLLDVDYTRYAEAEAALGWVNLQLEITLRKPLSPAMLIGPLIDDIDVRLSEADIALAHLKAFDRTATSFLKVSLTQNGGDPQPDGDIVGSPERRHEVVINLRAIGDPAQLLSILHAALDATSGKITIRHSGAFRPSPPKPEHRFTKTST